jgi:hypothetical protein
MITDKTPQESVLKDEYLRSEGMVTLNLPPAEPLRSMADQLKAAMAREDRQEIQSLCNAITSYVSKSFNVSVPKIRVLGVRPFEGEGNEVNELFGDYDFKTMRIRLWMRTAVLGKMTSFGTLLSTLCHEICHHLDVVKFEFEHTYHTRGFYERAGMLYHHVSGTPRRILVWDRQKNGVMRINWPATMRGAKKSDVSRS